MMPMMPMMPMMSIQLVTRRQQRMGLAVLLATLALSACGGNTSAQVNPTATPAPFVTLAAIIHLAPPSGGSHAIANGLWFVGQDAQTFDEIDPATNAVVAAVAAPAGMAGRFGSFFAGADSLWIGLDGRIVRLDPNSGRVLATISLSGLRADGARMVADATSLWVGETYENALTRIDLKTNQVVKVIPIDALPTSVAVADGSIWVCAHHSFHAQPALWRIYPATYQTLATIDTTEGQGYQCDFAIPDANGVIWVATTQELQNQYDLLRVDPATNHVTAIAAIADAFTAWPPTPVASGCQIWIAVRSSAMTRAAIR
jgi:DNA-binding beta-propeller fold protein YncE